VKLPSLFLAPALALFAFGPPAAGQVTVTRGPALAKVGPDVATVQWTTSPPSAGAVEWGLTPALGETTAPTRVASLHEVEIAGLLPNQVYHYRLLAEGAPASPVFTFKTAETPALSSFRFALFGDSGSGNANQDGVATLLGELDPDLVFIAGDVIYPAGAASSMDERYFVPYASLLPERPFYLAPGNHDYDTDCAQPYLDAFCLPTSEPGGERYYSFDRGTVHFVCVDSETVDNLPSGCSPDPAFAAQLAWLDADLAASTALWKIVVFHRSPYSYSNHGNDSNIQEFVVPILEARGVDLVFTGHDHCYQRFPQMLGGAPAVGGVRYIVAGTGGSSLYPISPGPLLEVGIVSFGSVIADVCGNQLQLRFYGSESGNYGQVLDDLLLTKGPPIPCDGPGGGPASVTRGPAVAKVGTTGATVQWTTSPPSAGAVEWGLTATLGEATEPTPVASLHEVDLTGLLPDQVYHYRLLAQGVPASPIFSFQTAETPRLSSFRFAMFGDSGSGDADQLGVATLLGDLDPDLVLIAGDVVYPSGEASGMDPRYFVPYAALLPERPFYLAPGNHDYDTDCAQPYLDAFCLPVSEPGGERYYSFDRGNVHFVSADSETVDDLPSGCAPDPAFAGQLAWLDADLAASTAEWKIVFFHTSPYSDSTHGDDSTIQDLFVPIFEARGVDLVVTAHDHCYQRFPPMLGGVPAIGGVRYVVAGTGGANLYEISPGPYLEAGVVSHGALVGDVSGDELRLRFYGSEPGNFGQVMDEVLLSKGPPAPCDGTGGESPTPIVLGNRFGGSFCAGNDVDEISFDAVAGMRASIDAFRTTGTALPGFSLIAPSGETVDLSAYLRTRGKGTKATNVPLPETGTYRVALNSANREGGPYSVKTKGNAPPGLRVVTAAGSVATPGSGVDVSFLASAGARLSGKVLSGGSGLDPSVELLGPGGAPVSLVGHTTAKPFVSLTLSAVPLPASGPYTLAVTGADGTTGTFTAKLKVHFPKIPPVLVLEP
jgi:3',5'-cyclic AMP phosphodiesterase CpdA